MRAWELRDDIIRKENENILRGNTLSFDELEQEKVRFLDYKKNKVCELDSKITKLTNELINLKVKINKKNIEIGIDEKLQRMKYLRIELSKIMNMMKKKKHSYSDDHLDIDTRDALSLDARIKELEKTKSSLDAEIQTLNWSTKLD